MGDNNDTAVPNEGFKVKLDHKYPWKWRQERMPRLKQLWTLLPLIIRYVIYYFKLKWKGKVAIMDFMKVENAQQIYGVPLGGIGSGSIGRGFRGEFCRFQLKPGMYEHETVDADQFIITIKKSDGETVLQSLLSTYKMKGGCLQDWQSLIDPSKCKYTGLYPRSWTEFDLSEFGIKLICRQISPVIPNNYKESSLPCAVFVWNVQNVSKEELKVTITFTFKNGIGIKNEDQDSTCSSKPFSYLNTEGVVIYNTIQKMPCTYAIAVNSKPDLSVSKCLQFDPEGSGSKVWEDLNKNGAFKKITPKNKSDNTFGHLAVGLAAQMTVASSIATDVEFTLVWDMPVINFPGKARKYTKYYTNMFGQDNATLKIVDYAFKNYRNWENEIVKWQKPVLDDKELPSWYKSALFNETYFVSDGGGVWLKIDEEEGKTMPPEDPRLEYGRFAYLEGHEYRMYNTYDVHFYASNALITNWPLLQVLIQYDFRDAILREIKDPMKELYTGHIVERKVINSVPHDLGDPGEEPFLLVNGYPIHDVSTWRDLNTKFVLQVLRDFKHLTTLKIYDPVKYLLDMFKVCTVVMERTEHFDIDGDGLIENGGFPDQTFDAWVMTGSSAYCGGLWIAALYAMTTFCDMLGKSEEKQHYQDLLDRGKKAYETKLWNGAFYRFDCRERREGDIIMADQACGQWYLRLSGYEYEVFSKAKIASALRTVYDNNVRGFCNGEMGAVNGFTSQGKVDICSIQSEEVWTGVTYALASSMIQEGMIEEAWVTAGGMFKSMTEKLGLIYETPEALYEKDYYRSLGYMRPLSIWAMQIAWIKYKQSRSVKDN